jgi:hypothetical protein
LNRVYQVEAAVYGEVLALLFLVCLVPFLAVYLPTYSYIKHPSQLAALGHFVCSLVSVALAFAWWISSLTVMAYLAPYFRDADHPFLQGFAVCYPAVLLLAALWWVVMAMLFSMLHKVSRHVAFRMSSKAVLWCVIITLAVSVFLLPVT